MKFYYILDDISIKELMLDLDSDCASLISAPACSNVDLFEFGRIVEDCKEYLLAIPSIWSNHVFC